MVSVKDEFIFMPEDEDGLRSVSREYARMGLSGCGGSVDVVHIGWDACPVDGWALADDESKIPDSLDIEKRLRKWCHSEVNFLHLKRWKRSITRCSPAATSWPRFYCNLQIRPKEKCPFLQAILWPGLSVRTVWQRVRDASRCFGEIWWIWNPD